MSDQEQTVMQSDTWAVIELIDHSQTAGRIEKPADWGGLIRVDVPDEDGPGYRTELYGISAIYSIKFVSEEIARAYTPRKRVTTREQHECAVRQLQNENCELQLQINALERQLSIDDYEDDILRPPF